MGRAPVKTRGLGQAQGPLGQGQAQTQLGLGQAQWTRSMAKANGPGQRPGLSQRPQPTAWPMALGQANGRPTAGQLSARGMGQTGAGPGPGPGPR